jgi:hypothetical protein
MKIRNGFVSNSSSSSFVVAFPFKPEIAEQVKELLWPHQDYLHNPWGSLNEYNDAVTTMQAAQAVLDQINNQEQDVKEALNGWLRYAAPDSIYAQMIEHLQEDINELDWRDESTRTQRDELYREIDELEEKLKDEIFDDLTMKAKVRFGKDFQFFTFEFEDHSTIGGLLEHGYTFDNLPFVRISRH